jgi:Cdc6-like AAA superfamily ATPase
MSEAVANDPPSEAERLELAADQAIAACGGDAREAVKALIVANEFLEREIEEKVSRGFLRGVHGRFNTYLG